VRTRSTYFANNDVLARYRRLAEAQGIGYQTLINRTLREADEPHPVDEETLRRASPRGGELLP
jgi:hypothetical protein